VFGCSHSFDGGVGEVGSTLHAEVRPVGAFGRSVPYSSHGMRWLPAQRSGTPTLFVANVAVGSHAVIDSAVCGPDSNLTQSRLEVVIGVTGGLARSPIG
jgi:hypothetical protein